jgi:hypothetical protein
MIESRRVLARAIPAGFYNRKNSSQKLPVRDTSPMTQPVKGDGIFAAPPVAPERAAPPALLTSLPVLAAPPAAHERDEPPALLSLPFFALTKHQASFLASTSVLISWLISCSIFF